MKIWSFLQEEADIINIERKCKFLPNVDKIPNNITATTNFEECISKSDYIFHVTPSKFTRNIVK